MQLSVRSFGLDPKLLAPPEHPRDKAKVFERRIVEVAQDRLVGGDVHGAVVVGSLPRCCFGSVAFDTGRSADVRRHGIGWQTDPPINQQPRCQQQPAGRDEPDRQAGV